MHKVSAFSDTLRQELGSTGIHVATIHPALTAKDLLQAVNETAMPPPFRHMTLLSADDVARPGSRRADGCIHELLDGGIRKPALLDYDMEAFRHLRDVAVLYQDPCILTLAPMTAT